MRIPHVDGFCRQLMDGSGIESILQKVYGENSVEYMMLGGKAIARALLKHILVESTLTIKLQ